MISKNINRKNITNETYLDQTDLSSLADITISPLPSGNLDDIIKRSTTNWINSSSCKLSALEFSSDIDIQTATSKILIDDHTNPSIIIGDDIENCPDSNTICIGSDILSPTYPYSGTDNILIGKSIGGHTATSAFIGSNNTIISPLYGGNLINNANGNTVIGNSCVGLTSGDYNVVIGHESSPVLTSADYCITIGYQAGYGITTENHTINLGYRSSAATAYSCQIGRPGDSSHSAIMKFYSQILAQESWRDTNLRLAYINGTGNMVKSAITINTNALSNLSDISFDTNLIQKIGADDVFVIDSAAACSISVGKSIKDLGATSTIGIGSNIGAPGQTYTGLYNIAMGNGILGFAALNTVSGNHNIAFGLNSLGYVESGSNNTCLNQSAGAAITTGCENIGIGHASLYNVQTGSYNVCIGTSSYPLTDLSETINIGHDAITTTAYSCQIGKNIDSASNAICKYRSQKICDEVWIDTFERLMSNDATGNLKKSALTIANTALSGLTSIDYSNPLLLKIATNTVLKIDNAAQGNIAIGNTIKDDANSDSIAIGNNIYSLTYDYTGSRNICLGNSILDSGAAIVSGNDNVLIGNETMLFGTTGFRNIALGGQSLRACVSGDSNVSIGYQSGLNITSGQYNLAFGFDSMALLTTGSNNICFGSGSDTSAVNSVEQISIGKDSVCVNNYDCQLGEPVDSTTNGRFRFRSQQVSNESFIDGNNKLAEIDSNGNIIKSSYDRFTRSSFSLLFTGPMANTNITCQYAIQGNVCTLYLPGFSCVGSEFAAIMTCANLPTACDPSYQTIKIITVENNSIYVLGRCQINDDGTILITVGHDNSGFLNTVNDVGFCTFSITYLIT